MVRISGVISREALPEDKRHIFDAIMDSRGRVSGPFPLLLHSPEVAGRVAHLGTYVRFQSVLTPAERELAIITTAREYDCEYEWYAHMRLAREAGVREEAIEGIAHRRGVDYFTPEEALLVAYGRELLRNHRISTATFEAARAKYGEQGVVDLTVTFGFYALIACTLNAFEVEAPGGPVLP